MYDHQYCVSPTGANGTPCPALVRTLAQSTALRSAAFLATPALYLATILWVTFAKSASVKLAIWSQSSGTETAALALQSAITPSSIVIAAAITAL